MRGEAYAKTTLPVFSRKEVEYAYSILLLGLQQNIVILPLNLPQKHFDRTV